MTLFLIKPGQKEEKYIVRDRKCLGRKCFMPVKRKLRQLHPLFGKTNFKYSHARLVNVCATQMDSGCPEVTGYNDRLLKKRFSDGWRTSTI